VVSTFFRHISHSDLKYHFLYFAEDNPLDKALPDTPLEECVWCGQTSKPNTYILPLKNGKRMFCSSSCLLEFRKKACSHCGEAITGTPFKFTVHSLVKEFCSEKCLHKIKKKENIKQDKSCLMPSPLGTVNSTVLKNNSSPILSGSSVVFNANNPLSFSWERYLSETESSAAPHSCFKQVCNVAINMNFLFIIFIYNPIF
jgi:hypothetical protein